jgi:uncharacterized membrane protein YkoI
MIVKGVSCLCALLCAGLFSMVQAAPTQAQLAAQAKVKESEAKKIALEQVPSGSIKSAEIEDEKGHLVWSFDISKPGTRNITEVLVDAKSGKIVSISKENPAEQAAEEKADKLKH